MRPRPHVRALLSRALLATLLLAASLAPLHAAPERLGEAVDADWILQRLQRTPPTRTAFVELHDSKLLKTPLRIVGEYQRPDEHTLVREVRQPYAETTTLRGGEATIARAGHAPRHVALARAPGLAGLEAGFGALLSGDRARLQQHYRFTSAGTNMHWTLVLTPRDAALAAKLASITLYGRGAELGCIETTQADGGVRRTLLASIARHAAGLDAATLTAQTMAALCHGQAAR